MQRFLLTGLLCLGTFVIFCQTRSLQYFVDEAVANSPLLKDLCNQVILNRLDSALIIAGQQPQVNFTSNDMYAPVIKGVGYDDAITNGANVSAFVAVNKSLLNGRSNKIQFAGIQLLIDAAHNNIAITEQDIKRSIIGQYLVTYGDWLQVKFISAIQEMLDKQEMILKKLTQKNVYRQADYLSFYVTLQQNSFKLKQQLNQYKNDYATLTYLVGTRDTSQVPLDSPAIRLEMLPDVTGSAFFKKYYLDSLTLLNNRAGLDINYRPKLNVFADAGYNSSLAYRPYKNIGTSFGLSLVIPIYDGQQKKLQYRKIETLESTRKSNQQFFTNQQQQQLSQLRQQLESSEELIHDINLQLKYIQTLITVNEQLLQTGEVRIYDYIMSLNNYFNATSMINDNIVNQWLLINQINYWNR